MINRQTPYRTDDVIRERRAVLAERHQWRTKKVIIDTVRQVKDVAIVTDYKGEVIRNASDYRPVPKDVLSPDTKSIVLASGPIDLSGSFAPTVDDAGFRHIPTYDSTVLYYNGEYGSRRIVKRRADGFRETLPGGKLAINGLPRGAAGADGPKYHLFPFWVPGTCNIGFVTGTVGEPKFAHLNPTADVIAAQRSRGREALTDGPLTFQLLGVPAPTPDTPPPPPPPPAPTGGIQTGNTTVNGTLTTTVDNPSAGATVPNNFNVQAHATDSNYGVTGWTINVDSNPTPLYNDPGPRSSINVPVSLADGNHIVTVTAWNDQGVFAQVHVSVSVIASGGGDPTPPAPVPIDPIIEPKDPRNCVMLGTEIVAIGDGSWWQEEMVQSDWARVVTESRRELTATPDHPIYTSRAGRTELRDVRKGDKVVTAMGEETVTELRLFSRPGIKVCVHMERGHLFWANGFLSHNKIYYS